ncbi:MAG TPA: PilZ domain-containing protein [Sphingomicrobium sp.]|nr:PilZ domain-containing protein [Sphingomicrobium sp.]
MNSPVPNIVPLQDGRRQPRTHLFVAATLYADEGSTPIHIRNMSPSGALVEAAVLPGPGSRIALRRGRFQATGCVAWRDDRRAGLKFDALVHVTDWMSRQPSPGQSRVDAMVASVRGAAASGDQVALAHRDIVPIETELAMLRADLADMGSGLIADEIIAATHPEIQLIDISLQRIDRILLRLHDQG